jgi:hypothetical protein
VCTSVPVILRPPRNTICGACYEGARSIINLINKLESEKKGSDTSPPNSCKASSTFMFLLDRCLFFWLGAFDHDLHV